ncbi:MAG: hypothetical protein JSR76_08525 [Verrucomicrobia bacterium]|nr:hypothetical protein [Verrucomicrobiota bacterium]
MFVGVIIAILRAEQLRVEPTIAFPVDPGSIFRQICDEGITEFVRPFFDGFRQLLIAPDLFVFRDRGVMPSPAANLRGHFPRPENPFPSGSIPRRDLLESMIRRFYS